MAGILGFGKVAEWPARMELTNGSMKIPRGDANVVVARVTSRVRRREAALRWRLRRVDRVAGTQRVELRRHIDDPLGDDVGDDAFALQGAVDAQQPRR